MLFCKISSLRCHCHFHTENNKQPSHDIRLNNCTDPRDIIVGIAIVQVRANGAIVLGFTSSLQ